MIQSFALNSRGYWALVALGAGGMISRLGFLLYSFFNSRASKVDIEILFWVLALSCFPIAVNLLAGLAEVEINRERQKSTRIKY